MCIMCISMHLLARMKVMLDFVCIGFVKIKIYKMSPSGFVYASSRFKRWCLILCGHFKSDSYVVMSELLQRYIRISFLNTLLSSALRINTVWVRYMVTLLVQNNIQKTHWKQRYRWKRYRSVTRRNVRHFPPAGGRMTPTSVCLWRYREYGDVNKHWRQRRVEPSQEMDVKKMINDYVSSDLISLIFANMYGAASSIQNCVSPLRPVNLRKIWQIWELIATFCFFSYLQYLGRPV